MAAFFVLPERFPSEALYALGERCLQEAASRRLDGEIYCAVHRVRDINPLDAYSLLHAKETGQILIADQGSSEVGWIEAPPFTAELKYAELLLPPGLATFYRDPRRVCATALLARALANEPPPPVSNVFEFCRS